MAATGVRDIIHNQGDTFHFSFTWKDSNGDPIDLTSYSARMQIRVSADSVNVIASMTTENSGISLGGTAGTVDLYLSADDSALLIPGSYKYDLEMITGGDVRKLLRGKFKVVAEITK